MDSVPLRPLKLTMGRDSDETRRLVGEDRPSSGRESGSLDGNDALRGEDMDDLVKSHEPDQKTAQNARYRLFIAFAIFGLLNNVLYVIILSAAMDLVPATTPKGLVAFFNIFPALITKVAWPLISRGQIRYARRVGFCTCVSWLGIVTIAFSTSLYPRLFGIALASLSSGLGELTFLQKTTTLPSLSTSRTALGAWSSGTGFAGIAGAGLWWILRGLGVKGGLGISSVLPLFFPVTYRFILPDFSSLGSSQSYQALASGPDTEAPDDDTLAPTAPEGKTTYLTTGEKLALMRPLVLRYMLPLCAVYIEEYIINSGVAPTLLFPIPTHGPWSVLFKSPRDYYPFWSLTYQSFVFLSRSSLSIGVPPIPRRLLPLPTIIQFFVLLLLSLQASRFIFASSVFTPPNEPPSQGVDRSITIVFLLMCLEGMCGGSAYVNTFYWVGREGEDGEEDGEEGAKRKMEKEFRIGATGASDSLGILFASLISMPFEIALCNAQVERGRSTCRDL